MNIQKLHEWPAGGKIDKDDPILVTIEAAYPPKTGNSKKTGKPWTLMNFKVKDDSGEIYASHFINEGERTPDHNAMVGLSANMTGEVRIYENKRSVNGVKLEIMGGTPYLKPGEEPSSVTNTKQDAPLDVHVIEWMSDCCHRLAKATGLDTKDVVPCVNTLAIAFFKGQVKMTKEGGDKKPEPDTADDRPAGPAGPAGPGDDDPDIPF